MNIKVLLIMATVMLSGCAAAREGPAGKLVYCSYSETGVAGLGKNYCELIADADSIPKVVVVLDAGCRFAEERRAEYTVDASVADSLRNMLASAKVYELDGYFVEEDMTGGTIYRIYMEYDSGERINAQWYGHDIKPEAWGAFNLICRFFNPWRSRTETEQPQRLR